jgi:hypothetical protein
MLNARFDTISNRQDWIDQCKVLNQDGQLVDLTGYDIVLAVQDRQHRNIVLMAQTEPPPVDPAHATLIIVSTGIFQFRFPVSQMRGVPAPRAYDLGCTLKQAGTGIVGQFCVGSVNVVEGFVP